ncbi:MAG: histidine phosphatase family protein [Pseudomonadota bacterium]
MRSLFLALLVCAAALEVRAGESVLALLAEPRTHAVMRHALAPGTGDPENFDISDCATQRNMDEKGRRQAKRAGEILREAGVRIDALWSSRWCRCLETAELLEIGPVIKRSMLNSFSSARWQAGQKTSETREALAALPADQTAFLVTHNVNAEALTGTRPLSGEIQVVRVTEAGEIELLGSVKVPVF